MFPSLVRKQCSSRGRSLPSCKSGELRATALGYIRPKMNQASFPFTPLFNLYFLFWKLLKALNFPQSLHFPTTSIYTDFTNLCCEKALFHFPHFFPVFSFLLWESTVFFLFLFLKHCIISSLKELLQIYRNIQGIVPVVAQLTVHGAPTMHQALF